MRLQQVVGLSSLLAVLAGAGQAAASSGLESPDNGALQLGRGGAWLARADDPLAAYYNPDDFTRRVADQIGARGHGETLTEALGADLWIDYVSDTGDDVSVSEQVARLVFDTFEVDDPNDPSQKLLLPRGQVLIFGGDTAYPVATELEIHNRVIVPYNRVLRGARDGRRRCLIGVAGNHDWYGGLDGFSRMFHARRGRVSRLSAVEPESSIDRSGQIGHFVQWIEAFTVGKLVLKRAALPLEGYTPVQNASYWALRLAPALDLWGADRQLRAVDFGQQGFFADARAHDRAVALCLADPAHAYLEPSRAGEEILQALDLSFEDDGMLVLAGDTHHYARERVGTGLHVTAGGGGAFLHPARISRRGVRPPDAEFPGPAASLSLALRMPFQVANGRAGTMVHITFAVGYLLAYGADLLSASHVVAGLLASAAATGLCLLIGGRRGQGVAVAGLSAVTGLAIGLLPIAVASMATSLSDRFGVHLAGHAAEALLLAIDVYAATLVAGTFLMLLTILGIRHDAFGALAHPGYKHFVRLRVRRDGSAIDAWVLGKVDPLKEGEPVVLVDRFTWENPKAVR